MKNPVPLIALVGRPNVGKSSLFNALTKKRQALVSDFSGVTRDRRFGEVKVDALAGKPVRVVDTGGWMPDHYRRERGDRELLENIEKQVLQALEEASVIVQIVDAREGVTPLDEEIGRFIRKMGKPFYIAANKVDRPDLSFQESEFYALGPDEVMPISAEHKLGIQGLLEKMLPHLGEYGELPKVKDEDEEEKETKAAMETIKVCIVGRPNVGKSSLLNQIVGELRSVASSEAGTTTDPVDVEIERNGQGFVIIDTAGIRRHAKRKNEVENLSVMYAERNLQQADIAFLVLDTEEGVTAQDSTIAAAVEESGCTAIIIANKWDKAPNFVQDSKDGITKFAEMAHKEVPFLEYAPILCISAEKGLLYGAHPGADAEGAAEWEFPTELNDIWSFALQLVQAREVRVSQAEIRGIVEDAVMRGPRIIEEIGSLRKIHQVGNRPPQFLAFVRDPNKIPDSFRRYLSRAVREKYGFRGNPIRWVFRRKS
jgi:GTP-binding protein